MQLTKTDQLPAACPERLSMPLSAPFDDVLVLYDDILVLHDDVPDLRAALSAIQEATP